MGIIETYTWTSILTRLQTSTVVCPDILSRITGISCMIVSLAPQLKEKYKYTKDE